MLLILPSKIYSKTNVSAEINAIRIFRCSSFCFALSFPLHSFQYTLHVCRVYSLKTIKTCIIYFNVIINKSSNKSSMAVLTAFPDNSCVSRRLVSAIFSTFYTLVLSLSICFELNNQSVILPLEK
jgi:hypothetical protein